MPCILRWPGRIPAGAVSNEMIHVTDFYVTLAKIAGAGTLVPITGFANAVVSPAIEFKAED